MVTSATILPEVRAAYAAGLSVLRCAEDGTKRPEPDLASWREFAVRRMTTDEMREVDFGRRAGFGLVAGPVSGHRECWDFDDAEVFAAFVAAAETCGLGDVVARIRAGYEDTTPGGGRRWIVEYPESVVWQDCTLARRPGRDGEPKVKTLIELPTFAIVAPSNGQTHPSGRPYVRVSGGFDTIARYTVEERDDLLALARTFDQMPRRPHAPQASTKRSSTELKPGDDFNQRASWASLLGSAGWLPLYERDDVTYWQRPGKTRGVSATTNYGHSDLFFVFSSSTEFDPETSYTKFGVYTLLHHGGDYRKAALALAKQGYGVSQDEERAPRRPAPSLPAADPIRSLRLTPASTIRPRPVRWLWEGRLPVGAVSLLGGREGVGKTIVGYTLAAAVTRGTLPGVFRVPKSVIVAATEDSWEHTAVPRLMAAGADLERVFRVDVTTAEGAETALSLPCDLPALQRSIAEVDAALVVLDPLLSRLDTALDTHKDAEVRIALEPLVTLAQASETSVLGLIHVNKLASTDPLTMLMGSRAFAAVARSVVFVMADPKDETRRLLGTPKNNLGRVDLPTLAFRIDGVHVATTEEGDIWTGKLEWLGESDQSIRDAVAAVAETATSRSATSEAADWLQDFLTDAGGTAESATIKAEGRRAGHNKDALLRACPRLGIQIDSRGFPRRSYWTLPPVSARLGRHKTTASTASTASTDLGETSTAAAIERQSTQSTQSTQSLSVPPRARDDSGPSDADRF